jgi:hypothetical protein
MFGDLFLIVLLLFAASILPSSSLSTRPEIKLLDFLLGDKLKHQIPIKKTNLPKKFLGYSIFQGHSALRNFSTPSLLSDDSLSKASKALLLICAGYGDAAHEVLLGVTLDAIEEAEYAATHPGQTSWSDDHPLEDIDDWVHSILHRIEGNAIGEGGHPGFENAKFWAAGGPKAYDRLGNTSWKEALCRVAKRKAPIAASLGVAAAEDNSHKIISSGGKPRRTLTITQGCWDPIRYIELCRECPECPECPDTNSTPLRNELDWLHRVEIVLLFLFEKREDAFSIEEMVGMCSNIS